MVVNINFTGSLIMGVVLWLCFLRLWLSYRKNEVQTIKYFAVFFALFGTFQLIIGFPQFLPAANSDQLAAFYIFGHIFGFLSVAYYSKIPTYLLRPEWSDRIFGANLLVAAVLTVTNFMTWIPVEFANNGQVFLYELTLAPLWIIMILVNWVLGGTVVFYWLSRNETGIERTKLLILAVGFLLMFVGGPLHTVSLSVQMQAIAEAITLLGVLVVFAGIYFKSVFHPEKHLSQ